jgi:hypothetical protein
VTSIAFDDPRPVFLNRINLKVSRVELMASHIVLLCGGKVVEKNSPDDPEPVTSSLRHAITRSAPAYETYRPEEITDWHADGLFRNLVDFEQELAGICSLVVVILESAGAIAELSAFSQLPELNKKIIAIKSREYEAPLKVNSFINLGILRFISENSESAVRTYPWLVNSPEHITEQLVTDVNSDLQDELGKIPKTYIFEQSSNSHKLTLVCELIDLFSALNENEILRYLSDLNVEIGKDELRRKLFLLERFQLIKREKYSNATFYLTGRHQYHRLRVIFYDAKRHDVIRTQSDCLEFYKSNNNQRDRFRAIQQAAIGALR